jgi:hypothetical protein
MWTKYLLRQFALSGLLCLLIGWPVAGHTMTVMKASVSEIAIEADLVIHAQVLDAIAEPVPGPTLRLRTRHTLSVWEVLADRGNPIEAGFRSDDSTLEMVLPGGQLGNMATWVAGVPVLDPGDEVILLLTWTPWGYQPLGYSLGTFFVTATGQIQGWNPSALGEKVGPSPASEPVGPWMDSLRRNLP